MSATATSIARLAPAAANPITSARVSWGAYARRGLATVFAAVAANTLFYYVGSALIGYNPDFIVLSNPSGAAIFTVFPAVMAVLLYAGLLRFAPRPALTFSVIAAVTFVVTLIPDLTYIPTVDGSSPAQTGVLMMMHVIAAAVIVRMLTTVRSRQ
jgi:hypothetical protein